MCALSRDINSYTSCNWHKEEEPGRKTILQLDNIHHRYNIDSFPDSILFEVQSSLMDLRSHVFTACRDGKIKKLKVSAVCGLNQALYLLYKLLWESEWVTSRRKWSRFLPYHLVSRFLCQCPKNDLRQWPFIISPFILNLFLYIHQWIYIWHFHWLSIPVINSIQATWLRLMQIDHQQLLLVQHRN